jgi:hypothetical protein
MISFAEGFSPREGEADDPEGIAFEYEVQE